MKSNDGIPDFDGGSREEDDISENGREIQNLVFSCPVDHRGTAVYLKGWVKPQTSHAPLLIVHDLGENIGIYRDFAKEMFEAGFSVFGFDLRGHGRSGRLSGHVPKFDALVKDLLQVVAWIRHKSDRKLPVIIGQGIGCLIAIHFQRSFAKLCPKLILVSPSFASVEQISKVQQFFIWLLAELSPTIRLPMGLTPRFLFPADRDRTLADGTMPKRRFFGITANFAKELILAMEESFQLLASLSCPTLFLSPELGGWHDYEQMHHIVALQDENQNFQWERLPVNQHYLLTDDPESQQLSVRAISSWLESSDLI